MIAFKIVILRPFCNLSHDFQISNIENFCVDSIKSEVSNKQKVEL